MAKAKRIVHYNDTRVIKNGTTTIVYGEIVMRARGKIRQDLNYLDSLTGNMLGRGHGETKGVSKLYPGDTYDEVTGRIVASKKGEMQGIRASRKVIQNYINSLETVLADMKNQLALVDARYAALEKDNH